MNQKSDQPIEPSSVDGIVRDEAIRAKVASVVQLAPKEKDSFWKSLSSNNLINLIVGFLLTGLIGSWLTTCYQSAADRHRREAELREVRRSERLATLDTVGAILNEGYYVYGIYYDAKSRRDSVASGARRSAFETFNEKLEKREILDAARLCAHFGEQANDWYVASVESLHTLNPRLRLYKGAPDERKELGDAIYRLRDDLFRLTRYLATEANSPAGSTAGSECRIPSGGASSRMR